MENITLSVSNWGKVKNLKTGKYEEVKKFTWLNNKNRVKIEVISYGVIITNIHIPDNQGNVEDVVLGFDCVEGYQRKDNPYFGALIGRVANRIRNGIITVLNEKITVNKNYDNKHQLHGGFIGFDKYNWNSFADGKYVIFSHLSIDGDEGYPGDLITSCIVSLDDENNFSLVFKSFSTKPTPVNLTNHSYFNLAGHATGYKEIYEHIISINANHITETEKQDSIPTGKLIDVSRTPYDFRNGQNLGQALVKLSSYGFDDNFCVSKDPAQSLTLISRVVHAASGRYLEVYSDQPGVQFYTSNYMPDLNDKIHPEGKKILKSPNMTEAISGKEGAKYQKHGAFCLETQKFPDASNHSHFPDTILVPGKEYKHTVIYKFGVQ